MNVTRRITFASIILALAGVIAVSQGEANNGGKSRSATFSKDVAPILFKSCVECHRPGETAPMSLLSYKDARPWARSIREKVVSREMPPWHGDPNHGEFKNDRRLTQTEIDTISSWVEGGAPEGEPGDLPPAPQFTEGWRIDKPDLILSMPEEFTLEANGPDEYQYFTIDPKFTEDKYVLMAEPRPGNRKIVHHISVFIQPPAASANLSREDADRLRGQTEKDSILYQEGFLRRMKPDVPVFDDACHLPSGGSGDRRDGSGLRSFGTWLGGYVPGVNPFKFDAEAAKRVPAGSKLIINVHYSKTTGKVEKDRSTVGLVFAKQKPAREVLTRVVTNNYFKIPPGAANHEVKGCWTITEDIHIVGAAPHMHFRGKDMEIRAFYPDGRSEILINVPKYDFAWQTMYFFKRPPALPKGTRLQLTAHFDNSAKNKFNPDPTKAVRWGDPTYDEMMGAIVEFTVDSAPLAHAGSSARASGNQ